MSLQVAHGTIEWLTSTTAGNGYSVSGLSFQPKAIMFWWVGVASAGADAATEASDMRRGIGFATSTSNRRAVISYDDDAALTSDCGTVVANDCIAGTLDNAGARDAELDLTAINSDGFDLTVDDQLATGNITVFWKAWGGDDIDVAVCGDMTEPASAGDVSPGVTGFTSDGANQIVIFAGAQATAAINSVSVENGGISFGAATGTAAGAQWCVAGSTDHASGTTDTDGIGGTGKVIAQAPLASGTTFMTANLSAWGTDAFTVSYGGTTVSGRKTAFLAIKGGNWTAGSYTINGDTGSATATVSGLAYVPKGVVIAGRMNAAQNSTTGNAPDRIGIGFGTSTSSRRAQGVFNENGTASSAVEVDLVAEFDSVLAFPSDAGALQASYDINAMNSDGFQIIVDTAGGVASEWQGYIAYGSEPLYLTGVAGTGAVGTLDAGLSIALTGNAVTGAVGSLGFPAPVMQVSFAELEIPAAAVQVAMTGNEAASAVGSVLASIVIGLTGVGGTGSVGSMGASVSAPLAGIEATAAVGTVTSSSAAGVALFGVAGTGGVGSFGVVVTKAITGEAATGAVGALGIPVMRVSFAELEVPDEGGEVALTGVAGTGSPGSLAASVSVAISGVEGTGSPGSMAASFVVPLSGAAGTGAVGTLSPGAENEAALTGVEGTGGVGSFGVTVTKAFSGNAATGAVGTLTPIVPVMRVSWAEFEVPGSSVALTGVSGTGAVGSLAAGVSALALTGVEGTGVIGNLSVPVDVGTVTRLGQIGIGVTAYGEFEAAAPSAALTGVEGDGAVGSVAVAVSIALSGVSGTGSVGSLEVAVSRALSGNEADGSVGNLAVPGAQGLTGVVGTGVVGTVAASASRAVSGNEAAGAVGTLTPVSGFSVAISGVSATGAVGTVEVQVVKALVGVAASGSPGSLSPNASVTVALSGVEASGSAGTLAAVIVVPLSGVQGFGAVDDFAAGASNAELVGVSATGAVGSLWVKVRIRGCRFELKRQGVGFSIKKRDGAFALRKRGTSTTWE